LGKNFRVPQEKYLKVSVFMHNVFKVIVRKWKYGHSPVILICGETGSGKTYTGLKLGEELREKLPVKFSIKDSMFTKLDELMVSYLGSKKTIFMIDEAKKHLSAREWWSGFNKAFSEIINTQRFRRNIYIVIVPLAKSLAKEHRDMLDIIIEMKDKGYASTYALKRRWAEIRKFEVWRFWLGNMVVGLPSKDLITKYKKWEETHKRNIYLESAGKVLGSRFCHECGYEISYSDLSCKRCGYRWSQEDIYILIKSKLKHLKARGKE
jgi:hypothetical protein